MRQTFSESRYFSIKPATKMREDVERQPLLAAGGDSQTGAGAQQNSFGFKERLQLNILPILI